MTSEKSYVGWYFLLIVIVLYIVTFMFDSAKVFSGLEQFVIIFKSIIPVLIIIFVLMAVTNYFVKPSALVKYMGKESGFKGWLIAIIAGIISTGPIYMWYPMLNDLQKHGIRDGLVAAFLYNRAIKIPLLPMLVLYFGLAYSIILMVIMILVSVLQGLIVEKFMEN